MSRRLVRKFGSLIGLLAILMTALAPAVSQALASGTPSATILSAFCSARSEILHTPQANTDAPLRSPHSAAGHWDACGYCNLAAHSPAAPPCAGAYQAHVTSALLPTTPLPNPSRRMRRSSLHSLVRRQSSSDSFSHCRRLNDRYSSFASPGSDGMKRDQTGSA